MVFNFFNKNKNKKKYTILLSSNCQTAALGEFLSFYLPDHEVICDPVSGPNNPNRFNGIKKYNNKIDLWITSFYDYDSSISSKLSKIKVLKIPIINFSGFHPDLAYATDCSNEKFTPNNYNSALTLFAYKKKISKKDLIKKFNSTFFNKLGYFDYFDPSIIKLKQRFDNSDLNFNDFFISVRRKNIFMYTNNHPKPVVFHILGDLILSKIGKTRDIEPNFQINDYLNNDIFPLYPDIADSMFTNGSYFWKINGKWIRSLNDFIDYSFKEYDSFFTSRSNILFFNESQFINIEEHF